MIGNAEASDTRKTPPTHYGVVHYDKSQQRAKRFSADY
jgi:hypothetical protein